MKKIFSLCVLGVFLFGLIASLTYAQKATDIMEKMIEAQGGRKLLGSIKDTTMVGTMEIAMAGMSGTLAMYLKEPNKMRMDMEVMGMVITMAFDGESAWWINPQTGATEEMPADQAEQITRQAWGNDILLNPDKHGVTYELKEKETLEGKEYHVLEQSFPDGWKMTWYIDAQTYLPYKTVSKQIQMGVEVEAESFLSDWKKVEGVMTAHTLKTYQSGEEAMTMSFTEVKYNTGIEDSLFKKD
ncbi:MAG: outer membrane lipoprotein-sorting protein [Candidatus Aminicenantes bacterium]|nr:outer membrane lipoprotein-sorting protein [Candidatus Aminicenantes bacterium]